MHLVVATAQSEKVRLQQHRVPHQQDRRPSLSNLTALIHRVTPRLFRLNLNKAKEPRLTRIHPLYDLSRKSRNRSRRVMMTVERNVGNKPEAELLLNEELDSLLNEVASGFK
jgi:hypothetical protein